MHHASVARAGHHLHGFVAPAVCAHRVDVPTSTHHHLVPPKERRVLEGVREGGVEIDGKLGDALFGGRNVSLMREAKLLAQRRLNARTLQRLPFDGGSADRILAQKLARISPPIA